MLVVGPFGHLTPSKPGWAYCARWSLGLEMAPERRQLGNISHCSVSLVHAHTGVVE